MPLLLFAGLSIVFLGFVVQEIRELRFYDNNGWDFSEDSDINFSNFKGADLTNPAKTNRERVLIGRPFCIVAVGILALGSYFVAFYPANWVLDENSRPGKYTYHWKSSP